MVQKVFTWSWVRGWDFPCYDWKTVAINPVNGYLFFELGKDKATKGEGWAPPFISSVQDTIGL